MQMLRLEQVARRDQSGRYEMPGASVRATASSRPIKPPCTSYANLHKFKENIDNVANPRHGERSANRNASRQYVDHLVVFSLARL
jgi:hypothetical protein